jgi:hypothetical protein
MGGLVKNNEPLFFTTFICARQSWKKAHETKKVWREGEVYLALPPLVGDYHYQEQKVQQLILNKPVNKLIFFSRSMG